MLTMPHNKLPAYISADRAVLRNEREGVASAYQDGYEYGRDDEIARLLAGYGRRSRMRNLAEHHLARMLDEVIPRCEEHLQMVAYNVDLFAKPSSKHRIDEFNLFAGLVPLHLAWGVGRRLHIAVALMATLNGDESLLLDFEDWRDDFLIRAQATLDCYTALGRSQSRTTDFSAVMVPLIEHVQLKAQTVYKAVV